MLQGHENVGYMEKQTEKRRKKFGRVGIAIKRISCVCLLFLSAYIHGWHQGQDNLPSSSDIIMLKLR